MVEVFYTVSIVIIKGKKMNILCLLGHDWDYDKKKNIQYCLRKNCNKTEKIVKCIKCKEIIINYKRGDSRVCVFCRESDIINSWSNGKLQI